MEETVKEGGEIRLKEGEALPPSPNPSLSFLALGEAKKEALKVASAFSCRAFCVEEAEENQFYSILDSLDQMVQVKLPQLR